MKTLRWLIIISLFPLLANAQQSNNIKKNSIDGPAIAVADTLNLGEIFLDELSDEHGKVQVKVLNTGSKPLLLKNVTGCCGTNIKEWPKAPILPGKDGLIKVEFRTEPRPQRISRTITIESNATNSKISKIAIIGIVLERKKSNEITL